MILERVADQMVENAGILNLPIETRLEHVVVYLNQQGYDAGWEACPEGYLIHTRNCPYHQIAGDHQAHADRKSSHRPVGGRGGRPEKRRDVG